MFSEGKERVQRELNSGGSLSRWQKNNGEGNEKLIQFNHIVFRSSIIIIFVQMLVLTPILHANLHLWWVNMEPFSWKLNCFAKNTEFEKYFLKVLISCSYSFKCIPINIQFEFWNFVYYFNSLKFLYWNRHLSFKFKFGFNVNFFLFFLFFLLAFLVAFPNCFAIWRYTMFFFYVFSKIDLIYDPWCT